MFDKTLHYSLARPLLAIFILSGTAMADCCSAVTGNCPYFEGFCNDFPFGTLEQDLMTC